MAQPKFTIDYIEDKDEEEVYQFSLQNFIKDEPLCNSMGLIDGPGIKNFILDSLPDKCSFKAVNEDGKIIGLVISGFVKRPKPNEPKQKSHSSSGCEKWDKIVYIVDYFDQQWNIFDLYPTADVIMYGKIICVDANYRGMGIAGQLIERCRQYMLENNIKAMKRLCTSHFSARVMEKCGLKEVYRKDYTEFIVNGEQLIKPASPHKTCKAFVLDI